MRAYEFRVRIQPDADTGAALDDPLVMFDKVSNLVFERFEGDVTPALIGGTVVLECEIEARSLDRAVQQVIGAVGDVYGRPSGFGLLPLWKKRRAPETSLLSRLQVETAGSQYSFA